MTTVGVRELRQQASELLRQVARGETIEITDRGRPVALLGPVPAGDELTRLRAAGQVSAAEGHLSDLPEPLQLEAGEQTASEVLARLRRDER